MIESIEKDLKRTTSDVAYTTAKAGLSSIPFVGGAASELFSLVLTSPVEKRKEEWLINIYHSLQDLQEKVEGFNIEKLSNNEQFVSVIARASQLAIMNHQTEKLKALHNAVINTALQNNVDENEQMMFLNMIDTFTPWHLKLIYYFENPNLRFNEGGINKPNISMGGITSGLYVYYSELTGRDEFVSVIFKELYRSGIINTDSLGGSMTQQGIFASRLTEYGKRFLKYIRNYDK